MTRREFITLVGGAAAAWPLAARAQQLSKLPTIGFLGSATPSSWGPWITVFVQRLRELGWIENRNVAIEVRWGEGRSERFAEIAAEFVRMKVDVIVTGGNSALSVKQATSVIPIVFAVAVDPVDSGLVASLARPGGNVTGLSMGSADVVGKRLELLREVVPGLRRLAIMANAGYSATVLEMNEVKNAARMVSLDAVTLEIRRTEDIAPGFETLRGSAQALYVCVDPLVSSNLARINTLALGARLPTMHGVQEYVEAGGLMSYGANFPDLFRRAAEFVNKILRGAQPADIPVEQPTKFDLVIGERRGDRYRHTLHPGFDHGPAEPASWSRASSAKCDAIVGPVLGRQRGDRMIPRVPLREALSDPNLLGTAIAGDSWSSWRTLLIAAMGEELSEDEREIFSQLTGREREPLQRVDEFAAVIGRRGGKSRAMATLATYIAGLCDHSDALVPGERGVLLCVALDQRVAKIILDYAQACFERSPILKQLIANRTADALELTNGITLEVRPASFRKLRGPTYVAVIADELAFWYVDAAYANPDVEILNAVEPGLATTGGPLILASSPHARRGVLWEVFRRHYGAGGDPLILVAHGATRTLNPSLPQRVVDRALEKDRAAASAEFLAQFRSDIETFIAREQVEACVKPGLYERPPVNGTRYFSFTDPSGGSSDSMVCAIGHLDSDVLVVDALREIRSPFDPESAVEEIAQLLALYQVKTTKGDRYSGQWCAQSFEKRSIRYEHAEQNKPQLYVELLPRINARTIRLLDHPRAINQICMLERRTVRGGRDSIDHPPNMHDDLANAIAGLCGCTRRKYRYDSSMSWVS